MTWNSLINTHYWSVDLVGVLIGEKHVPITTHAAIVDTGTSYVIMP